MSQITPSTSNVYYLPIPPADEPVVERRHPLAALRGHLGRAWWRVRLTLAELRGAFRRAGRRARASERPFLDGDVEVCAPRRPALPHPAARVIDFSAARLRLRPVAEA